jgi:hypothetical protein
VVGTINRNLGVARRILRLCERLRRDENTGISWLAHAPLIQLLDDSEARTAYPISWAEQDLFFGELTEHLRDMAEFDVNTGWGNARHRAADKYPSVFGKEAPSQP